MFYSGIADEAGQPIATQIKAQRELGWDHIELRMVDGTNITQLDDNSFGRVYDAVSEAGLQVSCFGSAIANWARPITCDPQIDRETLPVVGNVLRQLQRDLSPRPLTSPATLPSAAALRR